MIYMACFLVPAAEAIVTTVASKAMKKNAAPENEAETKITFGSKLNWLNNLLWGGSGLLAFEHLWHGEITPWFPFLTGAATPESTTEMLNEMSTVGVTMAVLVTLIWGGMMGISALIERKAMVSPKEEIEHETE